MLKRIQYTKRSIIRLFSVICLAVTLQACTSSDKFHQATVIPDPLEPVNRAVLQFNTGLDIILIEPLSSAYIFLLPEVVRDSVQNFFRNLRSPLYVANNVLQGDFGDAGVGAARFVINSTVGVGGLFDVAANQGLGFEPEDFGQTLASWGVGDGFYIVWPILGPSSLRDSVGSFADSTANPWRILAFARDEEALYFIGSGVEALDQRSRLLTSIRDLRGNSLDYYSSLKSVYEQRRSAVISDSVYTNNFDIPNYSYEYEEFDE